MQEVSTQVVFKSLCKYVFITLNEWDIPETIPKNLKRKNGWLCQGRRNRQLRKQECRKRNLCILCILYFKFSSMSIYKSLRKNFFKCKFFAQASTKDRKENEREGQERGKKEELRRKDEGREGGKGKHSITVQLLQNYPAEICFSSYPSPTKSGCSSSRHPLSASWLHRCPSVFYGANIFCSNPSSSHLKTRQCLSTIYRMKFPACLSISNSFPPTLYLKR